MNFKHLWDTFSDHYSHLLIHPQFFLKKYERSSIDYAYKYAHGVLLDIGCGRMPYKKLLLPFVKKYVGIDSPKTAKFYHGDGRPDIFADAKSIPLPNNSCDTILSLQVLEHISEPQKAISEFSRLLKPKGILILSTVQSYPLHDEPYDFFRFTKYGLRHILKNCGLTIIKEKEEGNIFVGSLQNFNIYLMFILKKLSRDTSGKIFVLLLLPLFLAVTTISNLLGSLLALLDKKTKFAVVLTTVVKK